jgi:hypothetical protein
MTRLLQVQPSCVQFFYSHKRGGKGVVYANLLFLVAMFFSLSNVATALPIVPVRVQSPPVIDGKLEDSIWQSAQQYRDFLSYEPTVGNPSSQATIAYAAYDDQNLYFGFRCFDTQPEKVVASLTKRDNIDSEDRVGVILDTQKDQQSAVGFIVNPLGVQEDVMFDEKFDSDATEDFVWYSAGTMDDEGYTVEIHIPLNSLRYASGDKVAMGIGFWRYNVAASEWSTFPAVDPDQGTFLSQMGTVEYQALTYKRTFEFLPSATHSTVDEQGKTSHESNVGFTTKLGLTSAMTVDATLFPDFNQVESDASQIEFNLRSAAIYDEKRPFFLEGMDNFIIAGNGFYNNSNIANTIHTRQIIDPVAGLKITGKPGASHALSALVAVDESSKELEDSRNNAVFSIARYKRLLKDDSYIGTILTSRELDNTFYRMGGIDGKYRLTNNTSMQINTLFEGHRAADGDKITKARSTDIVLRRASEKWYADMSYNDTDKDFDLATGFVQRSGYRSFMAGFQRTWHPGSDIIKQYQMSYWNRLARDMFHHMNEYGNMFSTSMRLSRGSTISATYFKDTEIFGAREFDTARFNIYAQSRPFTMVSVTGYMQYGGRPYYTSENPYQGDQRTMFARLSIQPNNNFEFGGRINMARFTERATGDEVYDIHIYRGRMTYQVNKFLFFRAIGEYNDFSDQFSTDFLASFTYIPGTVVHMGYGSLYERLEETETGVNTRYKWDEMKKSFFLKASYNWRL